MTRLYQIVWDKTTSNLSEKVNEALGFGWQCTGGPFVGEALDNSKYYAQALIKEI